MNEQWQCFDEQGRPLVGVGVTPEDGYKNAVLHGAAHVWIWRRGVNGHLEVLLQKRSSQKWTWPDHYDISAAGHITLGEEPIAAALRETQEEIGVTLSASDLEFVAIERRNMSAGEGRTENELCWVYLVELNDDYTLTRQESEVGSLEWKPLEQFATEAKDAKAYKYVPHGDAYFEMVIEALRTHTEQ